MFLKHLIDSYHHIRIGELQFAVFVKHHAYPFCTVNNTIKLDTSSINSLIIPSPHISHTPPQMLVLLFSICYPLNRHFNNFARFSFAFISIASPLSRHARALFVFCCKLVHSKPCHHHINVSETTPPTVPTHPVTARYACGGFRPRSGG